MRVEGLEARRLFSAYVWFEFVPEVPEGVLEGASLGAVVAVSEWVEEPLQVNYELTGPGAADVESPLPPLMIWPYSSYASVGVGVKRDNRVELPEGVTMQLLPGEGYVVGSPPSVGPNGPEGGGLGASMEFVIVDDPPIVSMYPTQTGSEDLEQSPGGPGTRPVSYRLDRAGGDLSEALDVSLSFEPGTPGLGSEDFTNFRLETSFAPNASTTLYELTPAHDGLEEGDEFGVFEVVGNGDRYIVGMYHSGVTSVADADFRFSKVEVTGGQGVLRDGGDQSAYETPQFRDADADGTVGGSEDRGYPMSFVRKWGLGLEVGFKAPVGRPFPQGDYWLDASLTGLTYTSGAAPRVLLRRSDDGTSLDGNFKPVFGDVIDFGASYGFTFSVERIAGGLSQASKGYGASGGGQARAYVTGVDAGVSPYQRIAFDTVLFIGCKAAKGLRPGDPEELEPGKTAADRAVIDAVWSEFSDRVVTRVDGVTMKYNHTNFGYTAAQMLARGDGHGQCTAWADLLVLALRVQGPQARSVSVDPPLGRDAGSLAVRPMPAQGSGGANYVPGTHAAGGFVFHQVVRVEAYPHAIYDPSYGTSAHRSGEVSAELAYQRAAFTHWFDPSINDWVEFDAFGDLLISVGN